MEIKDIKDESINVFEFGMVYNNACEWFSRNHATIFKEDTPKLEVKDNKIEVFNSVFDFFMGRLIDNKERYNAKFERLHNVVESTAKPKSVKIEPKIELQMDF
jgi:hypothetical protein